MTDVNTTRIASLAQIEKANEKINHSIFNHMRNNATNKTPRALSFGGGPGGREGTMQEQGRGFDKRDQPPSPHERAGLRHMATVIHRQTRGRI